MTRSTDLSVRKDAARPAGLFAHPAQLGALLAFLGVALGAFGAHALEGVLSEGRLATYQTAARYGMYHALGLLAVGALPRPTWRAAPWLFWGSVVFSGSLYVLALSGVALFGAVAPIGGVLQLVGWALLFVSLRGAWVRAHQSA
ncbi:DUF423 domain-containing protein [Truepera radiovictrix]|uniref:DUF423 domain-containing protein n=1 Tax=Truepera radiovictrix (strain DSM 17093 / CIP 108686 / LMG 22925 / RQ-24) TaxID=649638 RepID=D7CQX2_TRURR|nr:DUF423 domain-containing protein [Truepera radiovictrix]ADI15106.1 protein of unknown function DUF423 [Truepera radiovictrix DSM 17093]WMT56341.1 DUF423 domain-containing protein [Truepera radiovictrix]